MTIFVIGGQDGQLATSLMKFNDKRLKCIGRPEVDFMNQNTIDTIFQKEKPALVINAAAWTAVDAAEDHQSETYAVNRDGPAHLAKLCAAHTIPFLHVSTDYVFSGDKGSPYNELDPISPQTVYGASKAAGEKAILEAQPHSIILRTAWVYSAYGKNFVKTMLNAGAKNPVLRVVADQKGNPTCSDDLAWAIMEVANHILAQPWKNEWGGIYHAVGTGDATWYDLAAYALQQAEKYGQKMPELQAIQTQDWPTPAKRPQDSRLNTDKLQNMFGIRLPDWHISVEKVVKMLFSA